MVTFVNIIFSLLHAQLYHSLCTIIIKSQARNLSNIRISSDQKQMGKNEFTQNSWQKFLLSQHEQPLVGQQVLEKSDQQKQRQFNRKRMETIRKKVRIRKQRQSLRRNTLNNSKPELKIFSIEKELSDKQNTQNYDKFSSSGCMVSQMQTILEGRRRKDEKAIKKEIQRLKNRISAQQTRDRKKYKIERLQQINREILEQRDMMKKRLIQQDIQIGRILALLKNNGIELQQDLDANIDSNNSQKLFNVLNLGQDIQQLRQNQLMTNHSSNGFGQNKSRSQQQPFVQNLKTQKYLYQILCFLFFVYICFNFNCANVRTRNSGRMLTSNLRRLQQSSLQQSQVCKNQLWKHYLLSISEIKQIRQQYYNRYYQFLVQNYAQTSQILPIEPLTLQSHSKEIKDIVFEKSQYLLDQIIYRLGYFINISKEDSQDYGNRGINRHKLDNVNDNLDRILSFSFLFQFQMNKTSFQQIFISTVSP